MEDQNKIRAIFQEAKKDINNFLKVDDNVLQKLIDGNAINGDEKEKMEDMSRPARRTELVEILKEKDKKEYCIFVDILKDTQPNLRKRLQELEQKHGLSLSDAPQANEPTKQEASASSHVPSTPGGVSEITDKHIADVVGVLGISDVKNVYEKLGISYDDVERVEEDTGSRKHDIKAKAVFRYWRQINRNKATKAAIIEAFTKCQLMNSLEKLKEIWQI